MTVYFPPICSGCKHFKQPHDATGVCAAFPNGIPLAIWHSDADHRQPVDGDHGIRFQPVDADAALYAADLFADTDHAHQFVAERCLVCGCGEPENPHQENLPTMPRDPALRLSIDACPDCGHTVSEPDGAWFIGMTCPDCGHLFSAADESRAALAELRAFRADVLRMAKREY